MLNFSYPFDPLYCHEENSEEEADETEQQLDLGQKDEEEEEEDEVWVEAFSVLLASEGETHQAVTAGDSATAAVNDAYLSQQRSLAVDWVVKASVRLGFSPDGDTCRELPRPMLSCGRHRWWFEIAGGQAMDGAARGGGVSFFGS
ncbi:hypothetical protein HPP92_004367 [Vanilla planifolia]|uniref:Uncharacterized protein n=1 Tax=Vanilla planifolia TaxID=51239 RepID=A0A835VDJ9_VANPL|nr:hypothetical protein HPP92_004367 [Vanilla planifolia]